MKNKFNIWEYLYYRITLFYSKAESRYDFEDNKRRGAIYTALFISLNIQFIPLLIITVFLEKTSFVLNSISYLMVFLFLIILFYSINFFEKKNYSRIFNFYTKESDNERSSRNTFLGLYIFCTVVLLFLTIFIRRSFWLE
jgi:archaellum biogenesis protein FlaJ (TadC family)